MCLINIFLCCYFLSGTKILNVDLIVEYLINDNYVVFVQLFPIMNSIVRK